MEATNGRSGVCPPSSEPCGMLWPIASRRSREGFSSNATIWPLRSKVKIPMPDASSMETGCDAIVMSARRSMCASTMSA